ncbi:DUF4367 domain-containing protein [Methanoculleus sp. FWC-SCC3]|uniref:DUF4367 domain-containing protein n=1 Tax=Methanoculleus methanifontis TaxID=2584086 RepID=A0ABT8M542_9EURY|nr:DUF4367 domain-containing protein [Methanoculleus sp. FWC-SCC3]MDN7013722.1 DUF4367 domain-containing protein [Methanoculleus sp. FWC-SCC3]
MKPHHVMVILSFILLTAGCIEPVATDPAGVTPTMDAITELPPDNAPSLRDSAFIRIEEWEDPAEYTSFPPPSYIPKEYTLYGLLISTVWNETYGHYTTIGETLRYARNDTIQNASWTTDMTLLDVTWSKYGYNIHAKDQIVHNEPEPVDINGYTGLIYETESERLIVWTAAGNATYHVRGSLDREELIRVTQSIP